MWRKHLCIWMALFSASASAAAQPQVLTFGVMADHQAFSPTNEMVRRSMLKSRIQHLILAGDQMADRRRNYAEMWTPWFRDGFQFDVVALGNHFRTREEEMAYFKMPGEFYSVRGPGVRFIVLNADNESTAITQARFLENELQNAREQFIFLVYHQPSYTLAPNHPWEERRAFHLQIRPLLSRYRDRITAIINGHYHFTTLITLDDIPLIIASSISHQLDLPPINARAEDGMRVQTKWLYKRNPTWARLDIIPNTSEVWLNYVDTVRDEVSCSVRLKPDRMLMKENCFR